MAKEEIDGVYGQQFVKVLLPCFFDKLLIPPKFTQHLVNGNHQRASILSPLGKFWQVNVQREGNEMYFGSGWEDFVKAHGLSAGHFLVFRYQGNMVFTIKIFDKSGCLKQYVTKKEVDVDVEIPDDLPKDIGHENGTSSSKKGRSKKSASRNSRGRRDMDETPPKSSRRTSPTNSLKREPHFEKIVRHYNVTSMRIAVPNAFCSSNGLRTLREITLVDQKQRTWPVLFRPGSREGYLGRGWRSFSLANNLKLGDKCIFKLVSQKVMRVRVVRG